LTRDITTLKEDIEYVLRTGDGWTDEISQWVADDIAKSLTRQFHRDKKRKRTLRASNLGTPCERKLWYHINSPTEPEPLLASTLNKFVFGDLTESYLLGLCKAAGHDVAGLQDTVDVCGIRGSRDCVIDGMLFDVKSASSNSFKKFAEGRLREDDTFGYLSQLSTYLKGSQSDPLVTYKTKAGFLAFDKQFGHIAVDIYDFTDELEAKEHEVERKKDVVTWEEPPDRAFEPVPDGKSGNMKLPAPCSYCEWRSICWPSLRTFLYGNGPRYFTHIEYEPRVKEIGRDAF